MLKHLYLILLLTFLVGLLTGVYAYFVTRPPIVIKTPEPATVEEGSFEVVADMYGGCQMLGACPSYRIDGDGEYIYIVRDREGDDVRYEGELSRNELRELERFFEKADLEAVEDSLFEGTCPIAFDGLAYVYTIYYEGDEYPFDTCIEDTEGEPLFKLLADYFELLRLKQEN